MDQFLARHRSQMEAMGLPLPLHQVLCSKILNNVLDASSYVMFASEEVEDDNEVSSDDNDETSSPCEEKFSIDSNLPIQFPRQPYTVIAISDMDPDATVFILDHMWVTTFPQSRRQLSIYEQSLSPRLKSALGSTEEEATDIDRLWPHFNCFQVADEAYTSWYIMDEVGIAIPHSDAPNIRCCPLFIKPIDGQPSYTLSVVWPIQHISAGEVMSRDYLVGITSSITATSKSIWNLAYQYQETIESEATNLLKHLHHMMISCQEEALVKNEVIGSIDHWNDDQHLDIKYDHDMLKIYCDRPDHLNQSFIINHHQYLIVSHPNEADVLYLIDHTIDSNQPHDSVHEHNKAHKIINQYCWNNMIITKEALTKTVRTAHYILSSHDSMNTTSSSFPTWFPESYDLTIHHNLVSFLISYIDNMINNDDNYWILKKHTGKQSMDYPISNNISCLLRHCELHDRIACKYINQPLLLHGRKFDLRYHVLISSLQPLHLKRHELFVIRWANHTYSQSDYEDYQKHFTVMNFLEDRDDDINRLDDIRGHGSRQNIHPSEFISFFDKEYDAMNITWMMIQDRIDRMIRELFIYIQCAFQYDDDMKGYHPNACWSLTQDKNISPAKSMVGVDIMLDASYQPHILEVQWAPDCTRAMDLQPAFWDEILGGLYLDKNDAMVML